MEELKSPLSLKGVGEGGLNFRDLIGINKALIAKQIRRIIKYPSSLVSRVLKSIYSRVLKSIYFPDVPVMEATLGSNSSFLWKSLL